MRQAAKVKMLKLCGAKHVKLVRRLDLPDEKNAGEVARFFEAIRSSQAPPLAVQGV